MRQVRETLPSSSTQEAQPQGAAPKGAASLFQDQFRNQQRHGAGRPSGPGGERASARRRRKRADRLGEGQARLHSWRLVDQPHRRGSWHERYDASKVCQGWRLGPPGRDQTATARRQAPAARRSAAETRHRQSGSPPQDGQAVARSARQQIRAAGEAHGSSTK